MRPRRKLMTKSILLVMPTPSTTYEGNDRLRTVVRFASLSPEDAAEAVFLSSVGNFGWRTFSAWSLAGLDLQDDWTAEFALQQLPRVLKAAEREARIAITRNPRPNPGPSGNEETIPLLVGQAFEFCQSEVFAALVLACGMSWRDRGVMCREGLRYNDVTALRIILEDGNPSNDDFEVFSEAMAPDKVCSTMLQHEWPESARFQASDVYVLWHLEERHLTAIPWSKQSEIVLSIMRDGPTGGGPVDRLFARFPEERDLWVAALANCFGIPVRSHLSRERHALYMFGDVAPTS